MSAPRPVSVVLDGMNFLESPRWHDGRIWVSDFYRHEVLSAREDGGALRVEARVPEQPSGLGWLPDGRLLVVSMRDQRVLRREPDGAVVTHAELSPYVTGHANDMVVDRPGRAYVGNFGFDLMARAAIAPTRLLRVDPDGSVTPVADDLWCPNGSVIADDGTLLVGETFGNRVTAFDIAADGSLGNRRVWARFGPVPSTTELRPALRELVVAPDGCGLDAEGELWIADGSHRRVLRVHPGGRIAEEIALPVGTYACTLGGHDGRTLFICAAPDFDERRRSAAAEAQLLAVRVDVPHAGMP